MTEYLYQFCTRRKADVLYHRAIKLTDKSIVGHELIDS